MYWLLELGYELQQIRAFPGLLSILKTWAKSLIGVPGQTKSKQENPTNCQRIANEPIPSLRFETLEANMKKIAVMGMLAMGCMLVSGASFARVVVGVGIGVPMWGPGYYGPSYYAPPPVYYPPPPVYVESVAPPVYVQPAAPAAAANYRYYCQETRAYYPQVQSCPGNWLQVAPNNLPGNIPPPPP